MSRAQRMAATKTSPNLHHEQGAVPPWWRYPLGNGSCCAAALLLVLWACPAFAAGAEAAPKVDGVVHLQRGEDAPAAALDARRAYIFRVSSVLRSHWRTMTMGKAVTGVMLRVDSRGTITDVRIVAPSGSASVDDSVLRAVRATRQVPPPPAGVDGALRLDFIVP